MICHREHRKFVGNLDPSLSFSLIHKKRLLDRFSTDYVEGIEEEFDIGTEIDTWETLDALRDKAEWWLRHDDERRAAGLAAQQRVMARYGNDAYVDRLVAFIADPGAS